MNSQALILTPIRYGWAIDLTGGGRLASFRGPAAQARALRYAERVIKGHGQLNVPSHR